MQRQRRVSAAAATHPKGRGEQHCGQAQHGEGAGAEPPLPGPLQSQLL